ncbi:hypothetical protein Ct9H90mP29_01800 [bacterium]|nr:MAG: hypothetical protein Ct9H90mP29_01800 [bacterium]
MPEESEKVAMKELDRFLGFQPNLQNIMFQEHILIGLLTFHGVIVRKIELILKRQ